MQSMPLFQVNSGSLPAGGQWMNREGNGQDEEGYDMAITVTSPGTQGDVKAQNVTFIFKADTDLDRTFLEGSFW